MKKRIIKKLSPKQELTLAIESQQAIIRHRKFVVFSYENRNAAFLAEIDKIQKERDQLQKDFDSAEETIANSLQAIQSLVKIRGEMSLKAPSLSPRERKIARLKKSLATIENLRQEFRSQSRI